MSQECLLAEVPQVAQELQRLLAGCEQQHVPLMACSCPSPAVFIRPWRGSQSLHDGTNYSGMSHTEEQCPVGSVSLCAAQPAQKPRTRLAEQLPRGQMWLRLPSTAAACGDCYLSTKLPKKAQTASAGPRLPAQGRARSPWHGQGMPNSLSTH